MRPWRRANDICRGDRDQRASTRGEPRQCRLAHARQRGARTREGMPAVSCLDDLEAFALVAGTLAAERLPDVVAHVEGCADCHALIEGLCAETPAAERPRSSHDAFVGLDVAQGAYRITAVLAAGGMGRVYRAT